MSVQGMSLLRDHSVISGVQREGFFAGAQLHLTDDHLDGGLARVLVFFEILSPNERNHGLLQLVPTAPVKIVRRASTGRLARFAQHVLGNAGQCVFFHTSFCSSPRCGVTDPTTQPPRKDPS